MYAHTIVVQLVFLSIYSHESKIKDHNFKEVSEISSHCGTLGFTFYYFYAVGGHRKLLVIRTGLNYSCTTIVV